MIRTPPPPEIFILFLLLFSGSLRSPVLNIVLKFEKSESPLSSKGYIPSPVIHTIPGFIYGSSISMLISSKITRFYTILTKNFLGEDPQIPRPPRPFDITFIFTKAIIIHLECVFVWRKHCRMLYFYKLLYVKLFQWQK